MDLKIKKGFTVYSQERNGIAIVAPHSGPAFDTVTSRDDNSETVASLCFRNLGGKLIISNVSRKRLWGIDFNRDIPSLSTALKAYNMFNEGKDVQEVSDYKAKYAWVAKDENDYESRLRIYQDFWAEVGKNDLIILLHRAFNRIKAYPTIMDVITFKDKGIKKGVIHDIVKDLNVRYYDFLRRVENDYKAAIYYETKRSVLNILRIYNHFNLAEMGASFSNNITKDLKNINLYADKIALRRLRINFTPHNFLEAVRNALKNAPSPVITVENVFDGSLALGPKRKLFPRKDKIIIEVEPTLFMNFWHPHITSKIVGDVVEKVRNNKN